MILAERMNDSALLHPSVPLDKLRALMCLVATGSKLARVRVVISEAKPTSFWFTWFGICTTSTSFPILVEVVLVVGFSASSFLGTFAPAFGALL